MTLPLDATKIKIEKKSIPAYQLVRKSQEGGIDLSSVKPSWSVEVRSRFIESLLIGIPTPIIYFDLNFQSMQVVTSEQALLTLIEFCNNPDSIVLQGLEYIKLIEGLTYKDLPADLQRNIDETLFNCYLIQPGMITSVRLNLIDRIKTTNL